MFLFFVDFNVDLTFSSAVLFDVEQLNYSNYMDNS